MKCHENPFTNIIINQFPTKLVYKAIRKTIAKRVQLFIQLRIFMLGTPRAVTVQLLHKIGTSMNSNQNTILSGATYQ